jgi:hypothetical protein
MAARISATGSRPQARCRVRLMVPPRPSPRTSTDSFAIACPLRLANQRPRALRASVISTCARNPECPARFGPTRRGEFAQKRFLLRTSRPKGESQSGQPSAVDQTGLNYSRENAAGALTCCGALDNELTHGHRNGMWLERSSRKGVFQDAVPGTCIPCSPPGQTMCRN